MDNETEIWKDKTFLVAEDETSNYLFIKEILFESGANVIWAKTGKEVLDIVKEKKTSIDLILMDIKIPEINGIEATKIIKEADNNIPIVAQTAYAMEEDRDKCLTAGCDDYIAKPINIEEFLTIIKNVLEKYASRK